MTTCLVQICLYHVQSIQKKQRGLELTEDNKKCLDCVYDVRCPNVVTSEHINDFYRRYYLK